MHSEMLFKPVLENIVTNVPKTVIIPGNWQFGTRPKAFVMHAIWKVREMLCKSTNTLNSYDSQLSWIQVFRSTKYTIIYGLDVFQ